MPKRKTTKTRAKRVERIDEVGGQAAELLAEVRAEGPEPDDL